jgi:hypothetical protein
MARVVTVLAEDDGLFGQEQRTVAQHLSGLASVVGCAEVRMGAVGTRCGQLQHLRAERPEHAVQNGHRLLGGVQCVEE